MMSDPITTECLECGKVYDMNEHDGCPRCAAHMNIMLAFAGDSVISRMVFSHIVEAYVQKLGHYDGPEALKYAYLDFMNRVDLYIDAKTPIRETQ